MPLKTGFQSFVNNELPIGVPGDFASTNPRATVVGGPGQYVAPPAGTNCGAFAWFDPNTGIASNYYKPNAFLGFVHRQNSALITEFLGIATSKIVPGNMVADGFVQGDFFAIFSAGASVGQKVYADPVTGAATANATGDSVSGSATATTVTSSVMTVTTADIVSGTPAVGQAITGGTLPEGTYIASSDGTGSGTTLWNLANVNGSAIPNQSSFTVDWFGVQETPFSVGSAVDAGFSTTGVTFAPEATGVGTVMTVGSAVTGTILVGDWLSGTSVPQNTQVLQQLTGTTGGEGTYLVSGDFTLGATAITGVAGQVGVIGTWSQAGVA